MDTPAQYAQLLQLREYVAVLEHFDRAAFEALAGPASGAALAALVDAGDVVVDAAGYHAHVQGNPIDDAPARQAELHARAARHYRERMQRGETAVEGRYVAHVVRQCDLWLRMAPARVADVMAGVAIDALHEQQDRDLLRYYHG
ncbi:MAG TPA: hypothetical protein VFT99_13495, partial [Roseiflexaceae bacterium]|nr:hypothetical protein [Roseiflexaceae bacterium]